MATKENPVDQSTNPADQSTNPVDQSTNPADQSTNPADQSTSPAALDFSSEEVGEVKFAKPHLSTKDYDPRPKEDDARRNIAYSLIALLWLIVAAALIQLSFGVIKVIDIKEFSVILGPIVTLVSAATGFYYGTKSTGK